MQALIRAHGTPKRRLLGVEFFLFGIMRLAVIDVKMHHPFGQANRQNKANRGSHNHKHHNRSKRMNPGMLRTSGMKIYISAGQHFVGLQKEIGKKMLNLQKAEQQED